MSRLRLPRTFGCLACGRDNPRGLQLSLYVDEITGGVTTDAALAGEYIGFVDVLHGGIIATVADEAMVWAATWSAKRFCLCGELNIRYRKPARPGQPYRFEASVVASRPRLINTACRVLDAAGNVIADGSAKYIPVPPEEHAKVVATFLPEDASAQAARALS